MPHDGKITFREHAAVGRRAYMIARVEIDGHGFHQLDWDLAGHEQRRTIGGGTELRVWHEWHDRHATYHFELIRDGSVFRCGTLCYRGATRATRNSSSDV